MTTTENIFVDHNAGSHIDSYHDDCIMCLAKQDTADLSEFDTLQVYTHIRELLRLNAQYTPSVQFAFQLITNLEKNLRRKLLSEVKTIYG